MSVHSVILHHALLLQYHILHGGYILDTKTNFHIVLSVSLNLDVSLDNFFNYLIASHKLTILCQFKDYDYLSVDT